jgi:hypothetical protein
MATRAKGKERNIVPTAAVWKAQMSITCSRAFLALLACVASAGCFASTTNVRVAANGSGTIDVRVSFDKAGIAQLEAITGTGDDARERHARSITKSEARAAAASLGRDVRFVSFAATETTQSLVRVATYAFSDVRTLTVEPMPLIPRDTSFGGSMRVTGEHRFTFDLVPADDGVELVARLPDARFEYDGLPETATQDQPDQQALLRTIFANARLDVGVEPELPIVQTNTLHRHGQRVTLVGIDLATLLDNEKAIPRLLQPGSFDELRRVASCSRSNSQPRSRDSDSARAEVTSSLESVRLSAPLSDA